MSTSATTATIPFSREQRGKGANSNSQDSRYNFVECLVPESYVVVRNLLRSERVPPSTNYAHRSSHEKLRPLQLQILPAKAVSRVNNNSTRRVKWPMRQRAAVPLSLLHHVEQQQRSQSRGTDPTCRGVALTT